MQASQFQIIPFFGEKLTTVFPACHLSRKLSSAKQCYVFPTHLSSQRKNVGRYASPLVFKNNLESQVTFC